MMWMFEHMNLLSRAVFGTISEVLDEAYNMFTVEDGNDGLIRGFWNWTAQRGSENYAAAEGNRNDTRQIGEWNYSSIVGDGNTAYQAGNYNNHQASHRSDGSGVNDTEAKIVRDGYHSHLYRSRDSLLKYDRSSGEKLQELDSLAPRSPM